ncbi:hypothetical protein BT93_L2932 [Corymbia citriodora subsp. variegata]|uniref:TIR domain-containing protein n=1 Tax=Corymbia citriodora subsp. variegata TaxID=360336 RepID=A0A8T0CWB8_CORYI|nr:hypothetical protein BT93_L2932 [Corymbia citriodora subsp. variegata]
MKAIEESCIAIIIFSEDYASSSWCLEELAKIMECKEQKDLTIVPIFYKVDPREVREGRESYRRALAKQESKFGKDSAKVKRWKKALFYAGNLSGWHLNDGNESELINKIVKKISTKLHYPLRVAKHPVGIYSRVIELKSILNLESKDSVLMVGLWGQGGIGKTCLAKALYNDLFRKFDGACFLADVGETSKGSGGLVTLQEKILEKILLLPQKLKVSNVDEGINLIQRRLCRKKVLLILDNVDALCQLDNLAGKDEWFGNGSRVIVTTRNKQLLTCHKIDRDRVYKVKVLDNSQAHELLSKHAFQTHQIRTDLVDRALKYANGLPLALEVLGFLLCDTTEDVWESTIKNLSKNPDKTINDVLKVSFDGLDKNGKEIFLHIACFFKGWTSEHVKKVLDSCDHETIVGFDILVKRSLISIEGGILKMHDLIQAMGKDIVNQGCEDDPGSRNRLWLYDDVVDVLSCDMENRNVKAIVLALPEPKEMCIDPDAFTKLTRLKLLILRNVHDSFEGLRCLPNDLRWFEWPGCARQIPKFSCPKKLVGLNLSKGTITGVLKQFKDFQNLKYINFSHCELIVRMPDLSYAPNLEELDFRYCKNLVEAHESVAYLDKLQVLNLRDCFELSVFPNVLKSKKLRVLDFCHCMKFERFPDIPHKLEGLTQLMLEGTAITELPASIENLVALKTMDIHDCKNLEHLPSSIYKLQNLKALRAGGCTNLIKFPKYEDSTNSCMKTGLPNLLELNLARCNMSEVEFLENLSYFPLLKYLFLMENNITILPPSINKRDHLSWLGVENCQQLQQIPEFPPSLNCLYADNCESLLKSEDLTSIHHFVRRFLPRMVDSGGQYQVDFRIIIPQGEMPQWVLPIEEDSISFIVSKNLYDKILGLAFCFVLDNIESNDNIDMASVTGAIEHRISEGFPYPLHSEHTYLQCITPSKWRGGVDFGQIDGNNVKISLKESIKVKKWGFRIMCKQLGNDLKVDLRDNQLIDPALLYEVDHESTNSTSGGSPMHEDNSSEADLQKDLQDCQASGEEQSQTIPRRDHELFSLEACEPRPRGLLIRLAEMSMAVFARCFCCWMMGTR